MYAIRLMITLIIFASTVILADDISIDNLLGRYEQAADLSNQTKKESAGFLIVYTRKDLDRMQIKTLKEIIDKIPFIRYNEDNGGLTSPFYYPYQPEQSNGIKVYINDRELVTPYNGNALKLFGQMSIGFIDHIEVYMGVPSQEFGIQPAWFTIKCYTKEPSREETDLIGGALGSYGTKEIYGFSAKSLKNFSYMVYINNRNLKRAKINYNDTLLSKNKNITNFYGIAEKDNFRFEMQASSGSMDNFMGNSLNIDPKQNDTDFDYLYAGLYYKKNSLKAYINFSQDQTDHIDISKTILGFIPLPFPAPPYLYNSLHIKMKERVSDAALFKSFSKEKNKFTVGLQSRYKSFDFSRFDLGNMSLQDTLKYNKELTLSLMAENRYQFDKSNLLTLSFKYDKKYENNEVVNYNLLSGRIGYIYHNKKWTSKSFIFLGSSSPTMQTLWQNRVFYHQTSDPKKEKDFALATQLSYKSENNFISLLLSHTHAKDKLFFDGTSFKNSDKKVYFDAFSLRDIYNFDIENKLILNYWADVTHHQGESMSNGLKYYGVSVASSNTYGKFDFYNELLYKHWSSVEQNGWNLNSTVTYRYSRKLNFYIKGENLLNEALKANYISINPLAGITNTINNANVIDRRFWFGVEYQF
jgi:hypothetical protein